jgi:Holliday junction resolvase-like predicted endonuclease
MSSPRLGHRPHYLSKDRPTRIQRKGLLYEKKVVRHLVEQGNLDTFIIHGQWIYWDKAVCQPDIIVVPPKGPVVVVEVKLTQKRNVEKKLREVYGVALQHIFAGRSLSYCQIYKNLDDGEPFSLDPWDILTLKPFEYGEIQWR